MPFDEETNRRIRARLAEFESTMAPCDICGTNRWALMGDVLILQTTSLHPFTITPGRSAPVIALACERCGYLRFLSPVVLGVEGLLE